MIEKYMAPRGRVTLAGAPRLAVRLVRPRTWRASGIFHIVRGQPRVAVATGECVTEFKTPPRAEARARARVPAPSELEDLRLLCARERGLGL